MATSRGIAPTMELSSRELTSGGSAGLVANFYKADKRVQREIKGATTRAADREMQIMDVICPVDTDFMRQHIRVEITKAGLSFEAGWRYIDFVAAGLAFYPYFVEYGTVKMVAQPTLGPATREVVPAYRADVRRSVQGAIRRMSKL